MTRLAIVPPLIIKDWEPQFLLRVQTELAQQGPDSTFRLVDDVEEADVVFYVDSNQSARSLSEYQKLFQWASEKQKFLFALSIQDNPLGAFPGIYTSLGPANFDPKLHLSWPHLEAPNRIVEDAAETPPTQDSLLFTFSGSCSHPLRRKLFSIYESGSDARCKVREVKRWYDHTESEHETYVEDILNSRFVLCPRGIACYSHRIFETILLDRVPVIIADDWIPFSFAQEDYYVKIPESEVGNIASHLERELEKYDDYLQDLRKVKAKWLGQNRYRKVIEDFLSFHRQHKAAHDPKVLLDRLKSPEFRRSNDLLTHQKLLASASAIPRNSTKVLEKLSQYFSGPSSEDAASRPPFER